MTIKCCHPVDVHTVWVDFTSRHEDFILMLSLHGVNPDRKYGETKGYDMQQRFDSRYTEVDLLKRTEPKQLGQCRQSLVTLRSVAAVRPVSQCLTCRGDSCEFHSSSLRAGPAHPGRGNKGAAGRGCPVVSAPPGWMPFPARWKRRRNSYATQRSRKRLYFGWSPQTK